MESKISVSSIPTIDTRSLVDKVEMMLLNLFIDTGLKAGDAIPKEVDLAEAMGVSRTVIREALSRLKTVGIVESKKHKGAILTSPNLQSVLSRSLIPNILSPSTLRDLFELRLVIEVGMADVLFKRMTPKDLEDLQRIVKDEPTKVPNSTLFDVKHEIEFHGKLYEITGNSTLKEFQVLLLPIFNYAYTQGIIGSPRRDASHYVSHKGLVEELANGTPEGFRQAMRNHLENHYKALFENNAQ
jgi:Transcriptional regulators